MADDISLIVGVDYKEMTGFIKTSGQTKRVLKEIAKEFARTGDQSAYMRSINQVVQADKKLAASSQLGRSEIMKLGAAMRQETKFTEALTKATQKQTVAQITSNKVMNQAKNRMNGNNMAIQQLGYQFGDFAVQVQSGTSAFVAFSQQGAQLAGILPMIAKPLGLSMGKAVALSAGLGILIPIVGVVGRALFEMGGNAKSSSERVDELKESLEELSGAADLLRDLAEINLSGQFAEAKEELKGLVEELNKLKEEKARDAFSTAIKSFVQNLSDQMLEAKKMVDEAAKEQSAITTMQSSFTRDSEVYKEAAKAIQELIPKQVEATKATLEYSDLLKQIGKIQSSSNSKDYAANMVAFANTLRDSEYVTEGLKKQMMELLDETGLIVGEVEDLVGKQEEVNKVAEGFVKTQEESAKAQAKIKEAVKEILDTVEAEKKSMAAKLELNKLILQSVKGSLKVREKEAELAREQYRLDKISEGIKGNHLKAVMALYDENAKVTAEIASSEDKAKGLADALKDAASAMSSLQSFSDGLDKKLAVSVAKVKALKSGADAVVAGSIAGMRTDLDRKISEAKGSGVDAGIVERMFGGDRQKISQIEASEKERRKLEKATRGGSDNVVNIKDIIAARELQMQQERSLIGLSEKQAAGQRVYYDLLKQNEDADKQLTETEIEGAAKSIAAFEEQNRVLQEAVDKQEEIADTIASSMGDAFMSIVDGTKSAKDAFKDMAREIIKRLYEILVVEQLVQSISGTIKGAFSGSAAPATSPRPKIRPFADGGVLSGPTMFPMAGGKTGLMGEAGPEAIMPLKRGANGKLGVQMEGGAGSTTVVQNFNFQANGDDSVKRIIAQAAPQIANMTKKSMLDDRRRGGQMKATFG